MTLLESAPGWLAALLIFLLLLAAAEDAWRMEIGNLTSGAIALAAFVAIALAGPVIGVWQNLALFGAVLVAGTILFDRGWMGGGDIKLLAASSLWFDLSSGWKMLVAVAIAGGLETLLVLLIRILPWPDSVRSRIMLFQRRSGIPYGIAIAVGVILATVWIRR